MVIHNMSSNTKLRFALRYVLETDGMSIRELGRRSGKPHSHLSKILAGKVPDPGLDMWDSLAQATGTTVRDLLAMPDLEVVKAKNRAELLRILPRIPGGKRKKMARTA